MALQADSNVQSSLQEIAELLLIIYEEYLGNIENVHNILFCLCQFVSDVGLGYYISFLDIEFLRQKVMNRLQLKNSAHIMDYEMFYAWLKEASNHIYRMDYLEGGKKSLHSMLTKYIIPFASSAETNHSDNFSNLYCELSISQNSMDIFVEYKDFLKLWFIYLNNNVSN